MTAALATANRLGTCRRNKAHRFVATNKAEMATACPTCPAVERMSLTGEMQTFRSGIAWKAVESRTSAKKCTGSCSAAASIACSCECGGRHHGKSLGLAV